MLDQRNRKSESISSKNEEQFFRYMNKKDSIINAESQELLSSTIASRYDQMSSSAVYWLVH